MLSDWGGTVYGLSELGVSALPRGVIAGNHEQKEEAATASPVEDRNESAGQAGVGGPLQPAITRNGKPDADGEGGDIDHDAPSSDTINGSELDWAHGYGRGQ